MQICFHEISSPISRSERVVEMRCIEFFRAKRFNQIPIRREMTDFELHDRLLVPKSHIIRKKSIFPELSQIISEENFQILSDIYRNSYGEDFQIFSDVSNVSTSTALLLDYLISGKLLEPSFVSFSPLNRPSHVGSIEIEMAIPNCTLDNAIKIYTDLVSYVLQRNFSINIQSTFFTWSAPAFRFTIDENSSLRGGAAGFLRDEIYNIFALNSYKIDIRPIVFIGVAVQTLSKLLVEKKNGVL